jgi:WD40 repeat protein
MTSGGVSAQGGTDPSFGATGHGAPSGGGNDAVESGGTGGGVEVGDGGTSGGSPEITAPLESRGCVGQPSAIELRVSGGTPPYSWSVEGDVPGLALTATDLAEVELEGSPGAAGSYTVAVTVVDDRGVSDSKTLTLEIESDCPLFDLSTLPHPCASQPYARTVRVTGGVEPYRWEALALPPGITLEPGAEPGTRVLTGTPRDAGRLTLAVTDGLDRRFEDSYELVPREACWLAYVADAGPNGRLAFVDPLLDAWHWARSSAGVRDFEFSPDGRFLVYQSEGDDGAPRLTLLRLADFAERTLDFESVTHFAWSPDSSQLAVIFAGSLGGIRIERDLEDADAELAVAGLDAVVLTFAPIDGALIWSGNGVVVYAAPVAGGASRYVFTSELRSEGFTAPQFREGGFGANVVLRAAEQGVFAIDSDQALLGYYAIGDSAALVWHGEELVAPNGRFTARLSERRLQIFLPEMSSQSATAAPLLQADDCARILAWSNDGARIACAMDDGRVAIHGITAARSGAHTLVRRIVEGRYRESADMSGARRVFSPSGKYLAFSGKESLTVADTDAHRVVYSEHLPLAAEEPGPALDLAFSEDESLLLAQQGERLWLHRPLEHASAGWLGDASLAQTPACVEEYVRASTAYCGDTQNPREFAWSPWSDAAHTQIAVMKTSEGKLELFVHVPGTHVGDTTTVDDSCADNCVGKFRFQSSSD